jgi:hypothetical protein
MEMEQAPHTSLLPSKREILSLFYWSICNKKRAHENVRRKSEKISALGVDQPWSVPLDAASNGQKLSEICYAGPATPTRGWDGVRKLLIVRHIGEYLFWTPIIY